VVVYGFFNNRLDVCFGIFFMECCSMMRVVMSSGFFMSGFFMNFMIVVLSNR
jgi:hypothetical protein